MATDGHAARVIGQLLGYPDTHRADPAAAPVLANRSRQYLHLVGHSFGCRFVCEAVQWAADRRGSSTLGWSTPQPKGRPFTVDSMLLQMASPRDAYDSRFTALAEAPLRGSRRGDALPARPRHRLLALRAERQAGIGYAGIGTAPSPVSAIRMRRVEEPYPHDVLDHRFVSVDASGICTRGSGPAGAHSGHLRPESAHLLLSLADHSRQGP